MPTEIRYAVQRIALTAQQRGTVTWWHQQPREEWRADWDERKLFQRRASALAVIWRHRDADYHNYYRFVLIRVTCHFPETDMMQRAPNPTVQEQEARVP